ncbi:MAG: adenosylmethionine decarboxylase [Bacteroidota bacterium]
MLGKHWLIELRDCGASILEEVAQVEAIMLEAARKANATIVTSNFHQFQPYGVSGVVIIQESHLTIHTWPEHAYAAIDIFTCGETINAALAIQYLQEAFQASSMEMQFIERGLSPSGSAQ